MTHFGVICPASTGHLNPMTTLGYELKRRGHRVTVVGILDAEQKTLAAGLEFHAIAVKTEESVNIYQFIPRSLNKIRPKFCNFGL
jgi:UDP:flavonoid glycosyltransferase YjiC (YdhE family)